MNGLLEIQTTNKWLIDYDFGLKAMRLVNAMMNGHLLTAHDDKVYGYRCSVLPNGEFIARTADDERGGRGKDINEPFINVLFLEGPITREGGACTYGSRQLRDMMMEAADTEGCLGHLLLINGPGGVSTAIPDMLQATDYARSKGQPIVGRIDGICASCHTWIATMCDEVYYNNPADKMGSVGIYWANILNKNGDIDPETGGTWHIVYDPESYDKNRFVRDLAEENDDTKIKEELIADGKVFRDYIKSRRPKVTDDMLHGKMFDVKDLEGILVVGQATMQETFNRIVALAGKKGKTGLQSAAQAAGIVAQFATEPGNILSTHKNNSINMKEKFPALFAALQVEEMQMSEEGAFLNMGLLETLNAQIEAKNKEVADAKALADQLTAAKADAETKLAEKDADIEKMKADHEAAVETLNQEHATALAEKDAALESAAKAHGDIVAAKDAEIATLTENAGKADEALKQKDAEIETLTTDLNGAKASLQTAEQTISERDQQVTDLTAQMAELQQGAGQEPQAGAAPQQNGQGAEVPSVAVNQYVYDKSKTYEENGKAEEQWNKEHGK